MLAYFLETWVVLGVTYNWAEAQVTTTLAPLYGGPLLNPPDRQCPLLGCNPGATTPPPNPNSLTPPMCLVYGAEYKPAKFTCTMCDTMLCETCAVFCDVKRCMGEFYKQECWCDDTTPGSLAKTQKVFCDGDCMGGICDTPKLKCRKKSAACKPWWMCGPLNFLQRRARVKRHGQLRASSQSGGQSRQAPVPGAPPGPPGVPPGMNLPNLTQAVKTRFEFKLSRFTCESAAIPPKVWDNAHFQWVDRGYLVFDKQACIGSVFKTKCFCYDKFLYLSGEEPLTSELQCDAACSLGACAGRTCGRNPPPPLSQTTPPPGALVSERAREGSLVMQPMDKAPGR